MYPSLNAKLVLPALRSRNYRLFFAGQGLSLIGSWMTRLGSIWLVYQLTNSAFLLGLVGFVGLVPSLVLVPFSGVLVDRLDRHRTLIFTQVVSMVQSLALAALALSGTIQLWHIVALSLVQGLIKALEAPTRQAFVPEMVERKEDLANAIALNSSMFNGAKLIGPAIAGLIIAQVGAGYCFLIDGLSYIAVIAALRAMRFDRTPAGVAHPPQPAPYWQTLTEGWRYAFNSAPIRSVLLLLALVSFMGLQYAVILPILATEVLQGGSETLGLLTAALGVGALISGTYLSLRNSLNGMAELIAIAPAILGSGLIALAFSTEVWQTVLMIMVIGFSFLLQSASSNTMIQTLVEDDKRGRVMSLYIMAFLGMVPLGNLFVGTLVSLIGISLTLVITGSFCLLGSLLFSRQLPKLHRLIQASQLQSSTDGLPR